MAFMQKAKKYAKGVVKRGYKMAKKRYVKRGQPNMKNIMSDVKMLKQLVNVEKKRVDFTQLTTLQFGALNGVGVSGAQCVNVVPVISQGTTNSTRNGNSVKLVSACLDVQFAQQLSCVNDLKLRWVLICRPDNAASYSAATVQDTFLEPNPFSTVRDFYSNRDPEYYTAFRVIKQGVIDLKQDQISSGQTIVQKKYPLKLNHHLKYNDNASTSTTKNAFFLLFTASGGDIALSTGAQVGFNIRWYYTDN